MSTQEDFAPDAFVENSAAAECLLTPQELAFLAGTTPAIIEQLRELDLIEPGARLPSLLFRVESVALVRKILRLQRHLQINFDSMALIFDLLERIDELERRISELEK